MKKAISLLLIMMMIASTSVTFAEDWTCPSCGNRALGNFCSNCGSAKPVTDWSCPNCGNTATGNFCNNCGSPRPSADSNAPVTIDFEDEVAFEAALNRGEMTVGKVVRFKVDSVHPNSAPGFNLWAGEHLNFITSRPVDVKAGDVVVARIADVTTSLGSWFLSYEILEIGRGETTTINPTSEPTPTATQVSTPEPTLTLSPAVEPSSEPKATLAAAFADSAEASELLSTAKQHRRVSITPSPDKYTYFIQDYVGLNLSSIGYTSMGGDRLDRYGAGLLKIYPITLDGTYIDIEDEDTLSQFVVVGQNITPNSELKLNYQKDSKGNEYSNLIDYQSIESIDLLVVRLDGTTTGNTIPYTPVAIKPAPDRYTTYVRNYVGKNLATVGYTSMGGDRLDEYHAARIELCVVTEDGTYIDIEDSDLLQQYVIIGQNIAPNTEVEIVYQKDSKGNEYDSLVEYSSVSVIDLQVRRIDGVTYNETAPYSSISITASPDKYTWYVRNYVGKNLASFGYTSLGGNRMDEYGNARIEFVLITPDRSVVDIDDIDALATWMVVEQDVEPNSVMTVTYQRNSKGEEYSNLVESVTYRKITLTLQQVNPIPEPEPPAALESDLPATTAAPVTSRFEGTTQNYRDFSYIIQSDDTAVIVGYSGNSSSVSIPSDMNGHDVSGIGPSVFENHTEITSVAMWADPTFIGERAFMGCTKLKDISISSDCTSIGTSAFEGCTKLQSAILWGDPEIGDRAFYACTSLKEISIGSDTKLIGVSAFEGCTGLKSVLLWGDTNISNRAFSGCTSLKEISIGSETEYIGDYAFYGCTSLKDVTLWGSDTRIGKDAFGNCPKLDKINQW